MNDLDAIDAARDADEMAEVAATLRRRLHEDLAAGCHAPDATRRISRLNDRLTKQLVVRTASTLGLDLRRACWILFGSQARAEQTLATDQDNGLVMANDASPHERERWLELGRRVNQTLAACGCPLCQGGVMAGEPDCCLRVDEWCERFEHWMAHGAPQDLLNAAIYFDLRALVGRHELVDVLRRRVGVRAAALPRFIKQMADSALRNPVALGWFGRIRSSVVDGQAMFDLKLHGTALFVEAARLYALALGVEATGTAERLDAVAGLQHAPADERLAWTHGFEALQRLRLQTQARAGAEHPHPNRVALEQLSATDRAALKQALRAVHLLQQRIELDYRR